MEDSSYLGSGATVANIAQGGLLYVPKICLTTVLSVKMHSSLTWMYI